MLYLTAFSGGASAEECRERRLGTNRYLRTLEKVYRGSGASSSRDDSWTAGRTGYARVVFVSGAGPTHVAGPAHCAPALTPLFRRRAHVPEVRRLHGRRVDSGVRMAKHLAQRATRRSARLDARARAGGRRRARLIHAESGRTRAGRRRGRLAHCASRLAAVVTGVPRPDRDSRGGNIAPTSGFAHQSSQPRDAQPRRAAITVVRDLAMAGRLNARTHLVRDLLGVGRRSILWRFSRAADWRDGVLAVQPRARPDRPRRLLAILAQLASARPRRAQRLGGRARNRDYGLRSLPRSGGSGGEEFLTHRELGDLRGPGFVFVPSPLESD